MFTNGCFYYDSVTLLKSILKVLLLPNSLDRSFSVPFELAGDIGQEVMLAGDDSLQHSLVLLILL